MSELEVKHPDFAKRLKKSMDDKNLDKNGLSDKTKISYEMIRRYCEGFAKPRSKGMQSISDALGVTAAYLEYGETSEKQSTVNELRAKIKTMQGGNVFSQKNIDEPQDTKKVPVDHGMSGMIPVISWVAAGSFCDVLPVTLDDVLDWIPKPVHLSPKAFGLIIQGRSMWPEFKPDEIIYVEPEITPWELIDGDLIVIHCNDDKQATFKQLVLGDSPDDMYLKPLNEDWPDQKIVPMSECQLVGIVDSKYVSYRNKNRRRL